MRTQIKHEVIYRHRDRYAISDDVVFFEVSRSGYYDSNRKNKPCKDDELIKHIQYCQKAMVIQPYGESTSGLWLRGKYSQKPENDPGRIMKKYGLLSEIRRRRKMVQMGKQMHKYENRFESKFSADVPNRKWVTDISYIHLRNKLCFVSIRHLRSL